MSELHSSLLILFFSREIPRYLIRQIDYICQLRFCSEIWRGFNLEDLIYLSVSVSSSYLGRRRRIGGGKKRPPSKALVVHKEAGRTPMMMPRRWRTNILTNLIWKPISHDLRVACASEIQQDKYGLRVETKQLLGADMFTLVSKMIHFPPQRLRNIQNILVLLHTRPI